MQQLLIKLRLRFPQLRFTAAEQFCWSPHAQEVLYDPAGQAPQAEWSLLHETGHAVLEHSGFQSDVGLLKLEVAAWEQARLLATSWGLEINQDHIQDCLDTYRDWLYRRSICPHCRSQCLQQDDRTHYRCFNCHAVWRVSSSRFCRAYRASKNVLEAPAVFDQFMHTNLKTPGL